MDRKQKDDREYAVWKLNTLVKAIFKHLRERGDLGLTERVLNLLRAAIDEAGSAVLPEQSQDANRVH